ncbi:MAG: dTMP kinase [Ktedonobacteraceae bacterium]
MNASGAYNGGWSYAAASYESKSATETLHSSSSRPESMSNLAFYGIDAIHLKERDELLPGRLIVIEGTDGVGRSTQINLLRPWLESSGYAVVDTEMTRSALVGPGLKHAKEGHTLGPITLNLFYATDFVDRFENQIVPALRAGFVVLTDRYIYSLMARAIVRGADPHWIRSIYGLALKPDAIFYLRIGLDDLVPRVLQRGGFDYWESGMDMRLGADLYESFVNYQTRLISEYEKMTREFNFHVIDASRSVEHMAEQFKAAILPLLPTG